MQRTHTAWNYLARTVYGAHKGNKALRRKLYMLWHVRKSTFRQSVLAALPRQRRRTAARSTSVSGSQQTVPCSVKLHRLPHVGDYQKQQRSTESSSSSSDVATTSQNIDDQRTDVSQLSSEVAYSSGKHVTSFPLKRLHIHMLYTM